VWLQQQQPSRQALPLLLLPLLAMQAAFTTAITAPEVKQAVWREVKLEV
jgi:hypothetical protein